MLPTNPPLLFVATFPNATPNPQHHHTIDVMQPSIRFFIRTFYKFFYLIVPDSRKAKPVCMKKMIAPPSNIHVVFAAFPASLTCDFKELRVSLKVKIYRVKFVIDYVYILFKLLIQDVILK